MGLRLSQKSHPRKDCSLMCDNLRSSEVNQDFASVKKEILGLVARLRPETIKAIAENPSYLPRVLNDYYEAQAKSNDSYPMSYCDNCNPLDNDDVIYALEIARTEYDYEYLRQFGIDFLMRIAIGAWDKYRYLRTYGD